MEPISKTKMSVTITDLCGLENLGIDDLEDANCEVCGRWCRFVVAFYDRLHDTPYFACVWCAMKTIPAD